LLEFDFEGVSHGLQLKLMAKNKDYKKVFIKAKYLLLFGPLYISLEAVILQNK
jgi:hypothetical protein